MGTVYSDVATIENAPTPDTLIESGQVRGKVRSVNFAYTATALADASVIRVCRLYKGDQVLLGGSWIGSEDNLGSGVTLALGDDDDTTAADADRYLEATAIATAEIIQLNDAVACLSKVPYVVGKTCWLGITTADESTGDIRGQIMIQNNS